MNELIYLFLCKIIFIFHSVCHYWTQTVWVFLEIQCDIAIMGAHLMFRDELYFFNGQNILWVAEFLDSCINSSHFFLPHHLISEVVCFDQTIFVLLISCSLDQAQVGMLKRCDYFELRDWRRSRLWITHFEYNCLIKLKYDSQIPTLYNWTTKSITV